jgi:spermidine synthase
MGGLWVSLIIVFMASACTLVLELVAGRILAPFIGVSLYTWTSIIGVCLAGISIGNFLGGVLADRHGSRRTLGLILLGGGLTSLIILPLAAMDLTTIFPRDGLQTLPRDVWLMIRIVLVTSLLFLPPTLILGMVSPIVIKLALTDLRQTGSVAGKIYAVSTVGSIFGTFLTGFYLVSTFGTRAIVLGVSIILIVMAFVFGELLKSRKGNAEVAAAAGLLILGLVVWMNPNGLVTLSRPDALSSPCYKETNYFCIKVIDVDPAVDQHNVRELVLDHLIHSYNSLSDPTYLKYGYIQVYADMIEYVAQQYPKYSAFFIGGGGYTLPRQMETLRPDAKIVVAEIDPGVTQTNFEMLGVNPNTRIITQNADARQVVEQYQGQEKFDLVFGDAFNDLQIPYHLTTREFAQKVRNMLKDDGLYLALVIDKLRGGLFIPSYTRTLAEVFPYVYVLNDNPSWQSPFPNTYVVAASATPIDTARLSAITTGQGPNGRPVVQIMPQDVMQEWLRTAWSVVLTDDYAPADNLIAPLFVDRSF